jgi:UDP-3-O-[3-hydroxymyristoyl] glucosamine N-acyltransferase
MAEALREFTASEAAALLESPLIGRGDLRIRRAVTLDRLEPHAVAFAKDFGRLIGICSSPVQNALVLAPAAGDCPDGWTLIRVANPRLAFARVLRTYFEPRPLAGIHRSAVVDSSASIADDVSIGPGCVIGPLVRIGRGTVLRNNVTVGRSVVIGEFCLIKSNSVIGEEGFGIVGDEAGNNIRLPHVGSVVIGDHVEIGALNTVCSGTVEPTVVSSYVKTDDHVHIAHNCSIGANTIVTACAEISGSVTIGERVWVGPNACIMNGIAIGERTFLGLGTVVTKSLPAGVVAVGSPARIIRQE